MGRGEKWESSIAKRANVQVDCEHIELNTGVRMGDANGKKSTPCPVPGCEFDTGK